MRNARNVQPSTDSCGRQPLHAVASLVPSHAAFARLAGFGEQGFFRMQYGINCMGMAGGGPCQAHVPTAGQGWVTLENEHIDPVCSAAEYLGTVGVVADAAACLAAAQLHANDFPSRVLNYAVWRGDAPVGSAACHFCSITNRGDASAWQYAELGGATSFALNTASRVTA